LGGRVDGIDEARRRFAAAQQHSLNQQATSTTTANHHNKQTTLHNQPINQPINQPTNHPQTQVFYHLPSLETLGIDVRADVSLALSVACYSLAVRIGGALGALMT